MRRTLNHFLKLTGPARVPKLASIAILGSTIAAFSLGATALADSSGTVEPITTPLQGDGTMSAVARRAMERGALRLDADMALKASANRASAAALGAGGGADSAAAGSSGPLLPVIQQNIAGQFDAGSAPPDTTGATGPTRYVQTVNRRFAIHSRAGALISSGTLNTLFAATANNFDPQVIWDNTTNRFYYAGDMVVSSTNNRLAWGFSKSSSPNNGSTDWCHYSLAYGTILPDYPKLGDNQLFSIVGVNDFNPGFLRTDLRLFRKPVGTGVISACPTIGTCSYLNTGHFTPVPANSIDTTSLGVVIYRSLALPATTIPFRRLTGGSATTCPTLGATSNATVASYTVPPDAVQPPFPLGVGSPRLDTLDSRPWQAIMSRNPQRGNNLSLWTQHTIDGASGATDSDIRYYEIRPDVTPPVHWRPPGTIGVGSTANFFNGAISSDRRLALPATTGDDAVIAYNVSSSTLSPRIVAGSSVAGAALTFTTLQNGLGPYRDFTCAGPGQTCRWGDYSGATPDPLPIGGAPSAVGITNQFSPGGAMPVGQSNWRTRIVHVRP